MFKEIIPIWYIYMYIFCLANGSEKFNIGSLWKRFCINIVRKSSPYWTVTQGRADNQPTQSPGRRVDKMSVYRDGGINPFWGSQPIQNMETVKKKFKKNTIGSVSLLILEGCVIVFSILHAKPICLALGSPKSNFVFTPYSIFYIYSNWFDPLDLSSSLWKLTL